MIGLPIQHTRWSICALPSRKAKYLMGNKRWQRDCKRICARVMCERTDRIHYFRSDSNGLRENLAHSRFDNAKKGTVIESLIAGATSAPLPRYHGDQKSLWSLVLPTRMTRLNRHFPHDKSVSTPRLIAMRSCQEALYLGNRAYENDNKGQYRGVRIDADI